jgi:hypothetical protein
MGETTELAAAATARRSWPVGGTTCFPSGVPSGVSETSTCKSRIESSVWAPARTAPDRPIITVITIELSVRMDAIVPSRLRGAL